MLGWLSGVAQRGAAQAPPDNNGSSYIEEPPETPAPVFAVRAFKTALFGTPHPNQNDGIVIEEKTSPEKPSKPKHSPRAKFTTPKIGNNLHAARALKTTPLMSPAKSILVTPGTAATRRKTVSFGNLDIGGGVKPEQSKDVLHPTNTESEAASDAVDVKGVMEEQPGQQGMTKEAFEARLDASKHRLSGQQHASDEVKPASASSDTVKTKEQTPAQSDPIDITTELTVDLTKPRSQSGQHWKAEYERYQKNSDRELKRVIQHEQNVKSYAEKKDAEATELQAKLKRELARCAAMETKVSKLATQLATSKGHSPEGSAEQEALMNDLSRQTALAIKYKRKADRYKNAIQKQKLSSVGRVYDGDLNDTQDLTVDLPSISNDLLAPEIPRVESELIALREELRAMRSKLTLAEERAVELEAINAKLKRNFLRVKSEMENYDGRRLRREARFQEREDRLTAEKSACEAKLEQLAKEHEALLRNIGKQVEGGDVQQPLFPANSKRQSISDRRTSKMPGEARVEDGASRNSTGRQIQRPSNIPPIDIWTMNSPNDTGNTTPSAAEPAINLSSIAISEATHEALREIDINDNSMAEYAAEIPLPLDTPRPTMEHLAKMDSSLHPDFPSSEPSSTAKRMNDRRCTIASPRPSMVNMMSSAVKERDTPRAATGRRRETSLVSTAAGSRRSTLNGGRSRLGELPPDRAAAAKARLAQRRSLKENRQ
ncbi:MAG: hypothetical protein Q9179_006812 [Wetmoreana sp. 5 TL-2023]